MKQLLAIAIVLASCKKAEPPVPVVAPVVVEKSPIPTTSTQLLTVVPADWAATTATMRSWQRSSGGAWQPVGDAWSVVIGSAGSAWGIGLDAAARRIGPKKQEGDRKSPAGVFALRGSYGYAAVPPVGMKLPYTPSDAQLKCVDDPSSLHYASIVSTEHTQVDWHSAEDMKRSDDAYTWVIDIAHNPKRVPGEGSCIFLHVWHGPDSSTVGCTAMEEPVLRSLAQTLDPARNPTYVLLPRGEYAALATAWGLPAL